MTPELLLIERLAEALRVIDGLTGVLLGHKRDNPKDLGLMRRVINGRQHSEHCPRGQWLNPNSPRPDGDPCSDRCFDAWAWIGEAGRFQREAAEYLAEQVEMAL